MRSLAFIASISVVAVGACTDAGSSILIVQNQVPEMGCALDTDTQTFRARGMIDTSSTQGYRLFPLVQNDTESISGNPSSQRGFVVEGAEIDLEFPDGLLTAEDISSLGEATSFTHRFSGFIAPDGGKATFDIVSMPLSVVQKIGEKITPAQVVGVRMDVKFFGTIAGGDVSSNTFAFWVDVCKECMQNVVGACNQLPDGVEYSTGGLCNSLQDIPIDCCDSGAGLVCPPVAPEPQQ